MDLIVWIYPDFIEHRCCEKVKYGIKYGGEQPSYFIVGKNPNKGTDMRKTIIRLIVCILVFFASLVIIGNVMNKGNTDMTEEMNAASLPLIYMNIDGEKMNCLHGYTVQPDVSYERECISPMGEGRSISCQIEKFGRNIEHISFEVRSVDGSRLIEDGELTEYTNQDDLLLLDFTIKDLIENNTEYNLTLILTLDDEKEVYYNTRIIMAPDYHTAEKIAFAKSFSERTFDKEEAKDLIKYLESNSEGDNSTFGVVTIHSSFNQITWGNLDVVQETEAEFKLKEIATQTASLEAEYMVSVKEGKDINYYRVTEFYRLRYTVDRIYLLDFERKMTQIFEADDSSAFVGNKVVLGIQSEDTELVESDGGNTFAFVNDGRLYMYHVSENKIAVLYSFYDDKNADARTLYDAHGIKILSIDETGNVRFAVYGYMNRGRHEGQVGIAVYYYNSMTNTVEEEVYIPYNKSHEILKTEMRQLSFVSKSNIYYFILNGDIYAISLNSRSYEIIAHDLEEDRFQISEDQSMLVWQEGKDRNSSTSLVLMNLNTQVRSTIEAGIGNFIKPLGFMGSDLIYGVAQLEDVYTDNSGITTFGMHVVRIQDENGNILKEYANEGIYVTDGNIVENQLILKRAVKNDDGMSYSETTDDQIRNNVEQQVGVNVLEKPITELYETVQQIVVKDSIQTKALKVLTPKEVIFEGERDLEMTEDADISRYYVYAKDGVLGIYSDVSNAINLADGNAGVVMDDHGRYVWIRGNRSTRNQIMAIGADQVSEDRGSIAVCLDTILEYEGITRNSQYLMDEGERIINIMQENLENAQILDLSGCSLNAILYYVHLDIPILALMDEEAVLIIGYNDSQVVLMDPHAEALYKKNITDAEEWFVENRAVFLSYLKH